MACTSGCPTKTCESYAACLRGKGTKVAYANSAAGWDASTQIRWDKELDAYRSAVAEGMQPATTKMADITAAKAISDKTGVPFRADV